MAANAVKVSQNKFWVEIFKQTGMDHRPAHGGPGFVERADAANPPAMPSRVLQSWHAQ